MPGIQDKYTCKADKYTCCASAEAFPAWTQKHCRVCGRDWWVTGERSFGTVKARTRSLSGTDKPTYCCGQSYLPVMGFGGQEYLSFPLLSIPKSVNTSKWKSGHACYCTISAPLLLNMWWSIKKGKSISSRWIILSRTKHVIIFCGSMAGIRHQR